MRGTVWRASDGSGIVPRSVQETATPTMAAPPTPAASSTREEARAPALPGPREPLGPTLGYLRDPFGYLIRCAQRYGDLFSVPTLLGRVVGCAHPDGVRELFAAPPGTFARWRPDFIVTATGESSLLISTGEQHRRDRKLLGPAFHGDRMRAYGETMRDVALGEAATWSPERPVRLHGAMLSISMEIILRTVFGADETTGLEPLRAAVLAAFERVTPPRLLLGLVSSALGGKGPYARFARMRAWVDPWLTGEIARRRESESAERPNGAGGGGDDILSLLVSARADDGATLSDQEIREQILTLLFAGHETVGSALAWALHLVASNPPVLARLWSAPAASAGRSPGCCVLPAWKCVAPGDGPPLMTPTLARWLPAKIWPARRHGATTWCWPHR